MEKEESPIYNKNTIEFVTVALEFCSFVETLPSLNQFTFVDKTVKLLPLLYLKATLLPEVYPLNREVFPEIYITEEMYNLVRERIATLLEEKDTYLDTFQSDMKYSDSPIAAFISEDIADLYQDIGNFVSIFRQGYDEAMEEAMASCLENFRQYWGQKLLNALKALHSIRYDENFELKTNEEEF